ncbi:MAG: hypothetical protein LQ338_007479 [Usnochroma carphineum]|nr:MAG: hypothetical protein LQ338_007479 [Usnochroma carphineum]
MAIHRDNDQSTQRLACFDTDATLDMVSLDVVKELGLKKEPYPGGQLRLLGESFLPEWRVCFDWHVSGRNKTYTSTFLVMNEQLSRGFDVSVSWRTIELIKFYHVKDKTFFTIDGSRKENKDLEDGPPKATAQAADEKMLPPYQNRSPRAESRFDEQHEKVVYFRSEYTLYQSFSDFMDF